MSEPQPPKNDPDSITIRSYPKTMLMYPTMIASFIIGLIELFFVGPAWFVADPALYWSWVYTLGFVWFFVFAWNMYILTFEFSKGVVAVLMSLVVIIALVIALVYVTTTVLIWIPLASFRLFFDWYILFWFTFFFAFLFFISWLSTRFYYFRVTHNEIIYKKGILGDSERWGTTNVTVHKEIIDLFEYFLFTSGRLTIMVPGRPTAIVIDNVPRINKVERKILDILKVIDVK